MPKIPLARCNTIPPMEPRYHVTETAADLAPDEEAEDGKPVFIPTILVVMNILQGIVGLFCFGVLLFVRYDRSVIQPAVIQAIRSSHDDLEPFLRASDMTIDDILSNFDAQEILSEISLVLIPVGFAVLLPVLWGVFAAVSKRRLLIFIYLTVLLLMTLSEFAFLLILVEYRFLVDNALKLYFSGKLIENYKGDQATDSNSLLWNALMLKFSCCGINNASDFTMSKFNRDITFKVLGQPYTINDLAIPLVCCKHSTRTSTLDPGSCAKEPLSPYTSHYKTGCYDVIMDYLQQYNTYPLSFIVALCLWQIVCIILVILLLRQIRKGWKTSSASS